MLELLRDCGRFITTYYKTISDSALRIYSPAFAFLHCSSPLKQAYEKQIRCIPLLLRGGERLGHITQLGDGRNQFTSITFSPNGTQLAALTTDGAICVWHASTATLVATFKPDCHTLWMQFLPDNAHIVCGHKDCAITFWEVAESRLAKTISLKPAEHTPPIYTADASFGMIGVVSVDRVLHLWDTRTWKLLHQHHLSGERHRHLNLEALESLNVSHPTYLMAFIHFDPPPIASPADADLLFYLDMRRSFDRLDHQFDGFRTRLLYIGLDSVRDQSVDVPGGRAECLALSPGGQRLVVRTWGTLHIWDVMPRNIIPHATIPYVYIPTTPTMFDLSLRTQISVKLSESHGAVTFTAEGTHLLYTNGGQVTLQSVTDPNSWAGVNVLYKLPTPLSTVILSWSSNRQLACITGGGITLVEGDQGGVSLDRESDVFDSIVDVRLTHDGSHAFEFIGEKSRFVNIETGAVANHVLRVAGKVECTISLPYSAQIVVGTTSGAVLLYNIGVEIKQRLLYRHSDSYSVKLVGWSTNGAMVLSVDDLGEVCIWDIRHRSLRRSRNRFRISG